MEHDISELVEIQHRIADREDKPMNEPWMFSMECAQAYAEHMCKEVSAWAPASQPPPINELGPDGDPMSREVIGVTDYGYAATVRYGIDVYAGDDSHSWMKLREDSGNPEHLDVVEWIDLPEST